MIVFIVKERGAIDCLMKITDNKTKTINEKQRRLKPWKQLT